MHTSGPKIFAGFNIDIWKQGLFQTYDLKNNFINMNRENDTQILILSNVGEKLPSDFNVIHVRENDPQILM